MNRLVATFACLAVAGAAESALAADAQLTRVLPRGAQQGTEAELTFVGNNLADAQEILFYEPGVTVKELKAADARTIKAKVAIAPDARLGEYRLRVRTATGVSPLRTFFVGAMPNVDETEAKDAKQQNNEPGKAQKLDLNVTVNGVMENEGLDHYVVEAKQGQRITAEVEGIRLGTSPLDPFVAILDESGAELASKDDAAFALQDPVASVVAPKDGRYTVLVRDSAYVGNNDTHYRLHVGTFPRPTAVYPAGGQTGQELKVTFLGDVGGPLEQTVKLPGDVPPQDKYAVFAEQSGQVAPSGNAFRVSPFPNVLEAEPNDAADKATAATANELPLALNGIIEKPADLDIFRFKAKAGQAVHVQCYARRLRTPLDAIVSINDAAGKQLAANDDTGGPDSYLRFTAPADGEYTLHVIDQLRQGGPDYVYRIELTTVTPRLTLSLPFYDPNNISQERQAVVVPKGNRFATLVRATRADFGGPLSLTPTGLPDGVSMTAEPVPDGLDVVPVVFEAKPDAPVGGKLVELTGKPAKDDVKLGDGGFNLLAVLVPNANDPPFLTATTDRLAVAVAEEAPFKVDLVQPQVPLVQGGSMQLKVRVERKPGFEGVVRLQSVFNPPGVSAGNVEVPADKSEALLPVNAEDGARVNKWKVAVLANADTPGGRVWTSTQLADLEVAPPMMAMAVQMASVPQGKAGPVTVTVENKAPFEGKAKVRLVGLPPNVTAKPEEAEFASGDKTVTFELSTTDKTPVGQHKSLLAVATVSGKDGEPIVHNLARGGVLRVDAPPPPDKQPAQAKAAEAPKPGAAPLSRLEQLRRDAAAKAGK